MYRVESETVELKKSLAQLKEGIISMSAMLNKHGKGEVFFGVNDDGKIFGQTVGKKTLSDITTEIRNQLKPLPLNVIIKDFLEEDKVIIHVVVEGNDKPYSAYGRYYIRINDADISMDNNQLESLFENKDETYSDWEKIETEYDVEDIDEDLLIECIRLANDRGRLDYVYRNANEALTKLGLITENGRLNNAGLYLFGANKPITIKEANYPTDNRTEFGEIKEFKGNIFECIKESISYVQNHISFKSNIVGVQREDIPEIPLRALREIIINSLAHCSYQRAGDYNQYIIYKSSIRVYNPGNIIRGTDPIRFAAGKVGSKLRNPLISATLFKCGYIDAFGTGFDRTFTLCAKNNIEYEYKQDDFGFWFIFNRDTNFLSDRINERINDRINPTFKHLLSLIKNNKYITISDIANSLNKSEASVNRYLKELQEQGVLSRVGSRKSGYWEILDK